MLDFALMEAFWSGISKLVFNLSAFEESLDRSLVAIVVASLVTGLVFISAIIKGALWGGKWPQNLAQGIISASWVFPLLYIPYQGSSYCFALLFSLLMWLVSWLLLRKVAFSRTQTFQRNSLRNSRYK